MDFYDGAIGGFVELIDDSGIYHWFRYELFAWDTEQNDRVFGLAAAEKVRDVLARAEDARWPFWFPLTPSAITRSLEQVRKESTRFDGVILSDRYFKSVTGFSVITPEMKVPNELPNYETDSFGFWKSQLSASR